MAGATIWDKLTECVAQLPEPFGRQEVLRWFDRHYPGTNHSSVSTHLQQATSNSSALSKMTTYRRRTPLVTRISHGQYIRFRPQPGVVGPEGDAHDRTVDPVPESAPDPPAPQGRRSDTEILLVTCVKEKAPSPRAAKDLYTSALFGKERAYAERSGLPWFILSAEHGLVAPDEWLAPYERYLPDTPRVYREAWGRWVVARLNLLEGDLRGRRIEIHASEEYVGWLRPHLTSMGAVVQEPLKGLAQGQRLAWYGRHTAAASELVDEVLPSADELVTLLRDPSASLAPAELLAAGSAGLRVPGLYSWWVDQAGAGDLTAGLGYRVEAGLVYAGLAGATRWPSGQRSKNTLWSRITGMHLGGNHEMSTLRRTFGSILAEARGWPRIDEDALTRWMGEHLRVVLVPYVDADGLGQREKDVLERLDPPLNLMGMSKTELRRKLSGLRSTYSSA